MGMEARYRCTRTSAAHRGHKVFPYLLRGGMEIAAHDQAWCADITYIPVSGGFFYLAAVMDGAGRHVLSWWLSNTLRLSEERLEG